MTATDHSATAPPKPKASWRWTSILLVVSLALNCLMAGAIAARWFREERMERFSGGSFTQLLPRRFMGDLPRDRRNELMSILGDHRKDFRTGRAALRQAAANIAKALETDPLDQDGLNKAIDIFDQQATGLIDKGSDVTRLVFDKLSFEERKMLANRIRERAGHQPPDDAPPPAD